MARPSRPAANRPAPRRPCRPRRCSWPAPSRTPTPRAPACCTAASASRSAFRDWRGTAECKKRKSPSAADQRLGILQGKNELSAGPGPGSRAWLLPKSTEHKSGAASFDRGGHVRQPRGRKAPAGWPEARCASPSRSSLGRITYITVGVTSTCRLVDNSPQALVSTQTSTTPTTPTVRRLHCATLPYISIHPARLLARALRLLQLLLSRLLPRVDHSPHVDHSPAATMVWGNGGNGSSSNWVWELGHPRRARHCRARHCRARHCRARHCRPPPRPPSPSHAPSSPSPRPPPSPSPLPPWPLPCSPPPPTTTSALATAATAALATAAPATAALATPTPTSPPPPSPPLPAIATADDHRLLGDALAMASFDGLSPAAVLAAGLG